MTLGLPPRHHRPAWAEGRRAVNFPEYFKAQADRIAQITNLPVFRTLVLPFDDLYRISLLLIPPDSKPHFGRFLLVCRNSFVPSAAIIARAQPDDSQGVTRRAREAARIARAKHDEQNLRNWQPMRNGLHGGTRVNRISGRSPCILR